MSNRNAEHDEWAVSLLGWSAERVRRTRPSEVEDAVMAHVNAQQERHVSQSPPPPSPRSPHSPRSPRRLSAAPPSPVSPLPIEPPQQPLSPVPEEATFTTTALTVSNLTGLSPSELVQLPPPPTGHVTEVPPDVAQRYGNRLPRPLAQQPLGPVRVRDWLQQHEGVNRVKHECETVMTRALALSRRTRDDELKLNEHMRGVFDLDELQELHALLQEDGDALWFMRDWLVQAADQLRGILADRAKYLHEREQAAADHPALQRIRQRTVVLQQVEQLLQTFLQRLVLPHVAVTSK